jgi:hypothetical protein
VEWRTYAHLLVVTLSHFHTLSYPTYILSHFHTCRLSNFCAAYLLSHCYLMRTKLPLCA